MTSKDTILELYRINDQSLVQSPEWYDRLRVAVNDLIITDFNSLIQILYRLDVSEHKIRASLTENPDKDAAVLIANLLLERQIQKIESRKKFHTPPPSEGEESW